MAESNYFELNRQGWDLRARAHFGSKFYDVEGFLGGATSLREIELAELRDVAGKRLLHLQCHFGLDTLSWTRLGARCTGVDISPVAIEKARQLAAQTGLDAEFVCSDVYGFKRGDVAPFDIVFTSYGAICWLPDLPRWAELIASNLGPGGTFYMVEFHPIHDLLGGYSYFTRDQPDVAEQGTYTEDGDEVMGTFAVWAHPLGSVIESLINSGIQIEYVREYPFSPYHCLDDLVEREPGRYYLQYKGNDVPMVYSVKGRRVSR